nr:phage minor head protein [uncultured Oscillibacter sp.]
MCMACQPLIKAIDAYLAKADGDLADALDAEGYAEPQATIGYMQGIEDDVAEALVEETDYFLAEAEKAADLETFAADIWPRVKLNDRLKAKLATVFTEHLSEFMPEFVAYYIAQTDRSLKLEVVSKRTVAWVESWSEQLGEIMQLNSHKEIETILTKGLKDGTGIASFTREILDSGIRDEYYKARRVALTEVLGAHSVAQQEAFMQSPAVVDKAWKHTGAYRNEPRQNHVDMDGQRVPKDAPFSLTGIKGGTYEPMYPRDIILPPEERINCHCICQPVVSEDILGLSLEERQRLQQEAIDTMDDAWERELDARNKAKAGIDEE